MLSSWMRTRRWKWSRTNLVLARLMFCSRVSRVLISRLCSWTRIWRRRMSRSAWVLGATLGMAALRGPALGTMIFLGAGLGAGATAGTAAGLGAAAGAGGGGGGRAGLVGGLEFAVGILGVGGEGFFPVGADAGEEFGARGGGGDAEGEDDGGDGDGFHDGCARRLGESGWGRRIWRKAVGGKSGWRRERDSNPRWDFVPYSLSRGAPSAARPPLRNFDRWGL